MAFRIFRLLVSLILGVIAVYLIGSGVHSILAAGVEGFGTGILVVPVVGIAGGLLILGAGYYALWSESNIRRILMNIFSIPELLKKIAFTLVLLCIYRIGFHIPLPGLDPSAVEKYMEEQEKGTFGQAIAYFGMFTGGSLRQSTLFGLGIMPYISASIIFQLLTTVVPALEKLQKEGPAGSKKIQEYTRYATVLLCLVQAAFWMQVMHRGDLIYPQYRGYLSITVMGLLGLTAGTIFLMWLGEQIDEYGIGNGISLIIMAGIVSRLPWAIKQLASQAKMTLIGHSKTEVGLVQILFLIAAFVFVVAGAILITQGQRRIPIQQAKQMRGRRVYGGQRQYLPLRVNHGGVMPIIFASSLMIFPGVMIGWLEGTSWGRGNYFLGSLGEAFRIGNYIYTVCYIGLIFFFAYFWTTIQFRPKEMAEQLRDYGSFIPGLRPGRRTAEYLERVMERITYCGAAFLSVIAVIPTVVTSSMGIDPQIASFLGGTGLLIVVSVALDLVQRIEANLVMRNYGGFLGGSSRIKGAYG